jgi:hypothetical protein
MQIRMNDGRVFQGTAAQIVRAMQDVAFGVETFTMAEYIDWVAKKAGEFEGQELAISSGTDEEKAESLVSEMLRVGLAQRA